MKLRIEAMPNGYGSRVIDEETGRDIARALTGFDLRVAANEVTSLSLYIGGAETTQVVDAHPRFMIADPGDALGALKEVERILFADGTTWAAPK